MQNDVVGFAKRVMMEQDEQGWSYSDDWVCAACVDEEALRAGIEADSSPDETCTFCRKSPAAPLNTLLALFVAGLCRQYTKAIDKLYWDDDVTSTYDSWDLVDDYQEIFLGEGLVEAVRSSIHDESWVEVDFAVPHQDVLLANAWEAFCKAVKFETRYVIWLRKDDDDAAGRAEVPVARILHAVAGVIDVLGLIHTLPAGSRWWRAQPHGAEPIDQTPARLGTVPADLATQPNRMSPPGIPMFYGASDRETAVDEVTSPLPIGVLQATWAAFETSQDCRVVDFTRLPPIPSLFDPTLGDTFHDVTFLHRFVGQLSSKARVDWEAVDYVPTQVLTEFFLRVHDEADPVSGLVYHSAITGRESIVLDVSNDGCVAQDPGWRLDPRGRLRLGLVYGSIDTGPVI